MPEKATTHGPSPRAAAPTAGEPKETTFLDRHCVLQPSREHVDGRSLCHLNKNKNKSKEKKPENQQFSAALF